MLHFKTLLTAMTVMAAWAPSALAADCEVVCIRQDSACKHFGGDASRIELQVDATPGMSESTKRFTGDKDGMHFEAVAYLDGSFITFDAIGVAQGPFLFNVNYGKGHGSKSYKLKTGQETCQADIPNGTNYVTVAALTATEKN
jgi:hypothetical protein